MLKLVTDLSTDGHGDGDSHHVHRHALLFEHCVHCHYNRGKPEARRCAEADLLAVQLGGFRHLQRLLLPEHSYTIDYLNHYNNPRARNCD